MTQDEGFRKLQRKVESIEGLLARHELVGAPDLEERLAALERKQQLAEAARLARKEVKAAQTLILQDELKARRKVLKRLGFVDSDGIVQVKVGGQGGGPAPVHGWLLDGAAQQPGVPAEVHLFAVWPCPSCGGHVN